MGRAILNDHLPEGMPFVNGLLKKKGIGQLVNYCYLRFGLEATVKLLDELKSSASCIATKAGLSIGIDDMVIPDSKKSWCEDAEKQVVKVQQQYLDGAITNGERYNKVIDIWSQHHRESRRRNVRRDAGDATRKASQSDFRHGRLRRPRIEAADSPALRHARIDGQAFGRNHRNADHRQLP